jgi:hypothetical protein
MGFFGLPFVALVAAFSAYCFRVSSESLREPRHPHPRLADLTAAVAAFVLGLGVDAFLGLGQSWWTLLLAVLLFSPIDFLLERWMRQGVVDVDA